MRGEVRLALEVPRWTWLFYRRNLPLVVGLSLIPSVQRLVVVNWGEHIAAPVALASEVVVMAVRVALVVAVWRLALCVVPWRWSRIAAFARSHWPSLVIQGVFLTTAFLVFDVVAEHVVGGLLPQSARQGYLALLLFVKNPTVIALTMIWWVGLFRQMLTPAANTVAAGSR